MSRALTKRTTRLGRISNELHSMLCAIAWHDRKTFAEVLNDVAGDAISQRFARLPKPARDRLKLADAAVAAK